MLREIPFIESLIVIFCYDCSRITDIPLIPELQGLHCTKSSTLTKILLIPGLRRISCSQCPVTQLDLPDGMQVDDIAKIHEKISGQEKIK